MFRPRGNPDACAKPTTERSISRASPITTTSLCECGDRNHGAHECSLVGNIGSIYLLLFFWACRFEGKSPGDDYYNYTYNPCYPYILQASEAGPCSSGNISVSVRVRWSRLAPVIGRRCCASVPSWVFPYLTYFSRKCNIYV